MGDEKPRRGSVFSHAACLVIGLCVGLFIALHHPLGQKGCTDGAASLGCLTASNELRRALSDSHAALHDQETVNLQQRETLLMLEAKAAWAKGNRTVVEKKLRTAYGERSVCDFKLLNLTTTILQLRQELAAKNVDYD